MHNGPIPNRYQRNLGSLGTEGQNSLFGKKVIIIGLGGLGGYVLEELARLGVGRIIGVDPDVISETDLNRQLLTQEDNIGKKKVEAAGDRVNGINKNVKFTGHAIRLDQFPEEAWHNTDMVFDCLDNIKDRIALAKLCSKASLPLVHGAIAGWYGEISVIWPNSEALEKIYKSRCRGIEKDLGTPPFTAATAASIMVAEGVKVLTDKNISKNQKILFFDLLEGEWHASETK